MKIASIAAKNSSKNLEFDFPIPCAFSTVFARIIDDRPIARICPKK